MSLGYFADVLADGVDLVERLLDGGRAHDAAVDPDRKEDGVHAAFAHARDVDGAVGVALAEIVVVREEALRGVVVGVEDDGGKMQLVSASRDIVGGNAYERKRLWRRRKRAANRKIARAERIQPPLRS